MYTWACILAHMPGMYWIYAWYAWYVCVMCVCLLVHANLAYAYKFMSVCRLWQNNYSPLAIAVITNRYAVAKMLLEAGASVDLPENTQVENVKPEMAALLSEWGAIFHLKVKQMRNVDRIHSFIHSFIHMQCLQSHLSRTQTRILVYLCFRNHAFRTSQMFISAMIFFPASVIFVILTCMCGGIIMQTSEWWWWWWRFVIAHTCIYVTHR